MDVTKHISRLDSARLGFPVARIDRFAAPVAAVVERFASHGTGLIISRVPATDAGLINELERAGFRLKELQLTYEFDLRRTPPSPSSGYGCRECTQADTEAVVSIAAASFKHHGHYSLLDLPEPVDTGEIYADWARRCCQGQAADHLIVAEKKNEIAGFLALGFPADRSAPRIGVGILGAVAARHRGQGVYRDINIAALHWARQQGLAGVRNRVALANHPARRTHASLGYAVVDREVVLHRLLKQGR